MKLLLSVVLISTIFAKEPNNNQLPIPKIPFELSYYDIRKQIYLDVIGGKINVQSFIDENGNVVNPVIIDTFDITLNNLVLDRIRKTKYYPATQNGTPVKVRYNLPILFK